MEIRARDDSIGEICCDVGTCCLKKQFQPGTSAADLAVLFSSSLGTVLLNTWTTIPVIHTSGCIPSPPTPPPPPLLS